MVKNVDKSPKTLEQFETDFEKVSSVNLFSSQVLVIVSTYIHKSRQGVEMVVRQLECGAVVEVNYLLDNKVHNLDESTPAVREWYKSGVLKVEEWWVKGEKGNPDSFTPAVRMWYENGQLFSEMWVGGSTYDSGSFTPRFRAWDVDGVLILE